jgi:hypothetical protein
MQFLEIYDAIILDEQGFGGQENLMQVINLTSHFALAHMTQ